MSDQWCQTYEKPLKGHHPIFIYIFICLVYDEERICLLHGVLYSRKHFNQRLGMTRLLGIPASFRFFLESETICYENYYPKVRWIRQINSSATISTL